MATTPRSADAERLIKQRDWRFDWSVVDTDFQSVVGEDDKYERLFQEVIGPIVRPERADQFGVSPSSCLFVGPPGTGKSLVARATAGETGLPCTEISGSDVNSSKVNESSENAAALFDEANEVAGMCGGSILFVDEIDALLPARTGHTGHPEDQKVVNEFLHYLSDGLKNSVVVLGATNRRNSLDPAATRNGRFDDIFQFGLPDQDQRRALFREFLDRCPSAEPNQMPIDRFAEMTPQWSAADIEAAVNSAAKFAAFDEREPETVPPGFIEYAIDEIDPDGPQTAK